MYFYVLQTSTRSFSSIR